MKITDSAGIEIVDGPGFSNRHLGTVQAIGPATIKVRIDGLLGNPYFFTASFDGVIEDLLVLSDHEGA